MLLVYRWFRYGVFCYLIARNIPSSILPGVSCKLYYSNVFLVCTCNMYCVMPTIYKMVWNVHARVCCSVCFQFIDVFSLSFNAVNGCP